MAVRARTKQPSFVDALRADLRRFRAARAEFIARCGDHDCKPLRDVDGWIAETEAALAAATQRSPRS